MARPSPDSELAGSFPSTHWTSIRSGEDPAALERLARAYWRPIVGYLRAALGKRGDEARDLAQDFFLWSIETGFFAKADPARGRFRSFLKTALRHYAAKADERAAARKRGGSIRFVPMHPGDEDERAELADDRARTPEEILDEAWRAAVVRAAVERTRAELEASDRGIVFAVFRDWFLEDVENLDHRAVAERHGISLVDVANHLARARRAYRGHLRDLVRETVGSGADLEEELAWLAGGRVP
jgi:RNA polymerase sigma-70 factor (ECF subfamily)